MDGCKCCVDDSVSVHSPCLRGSRLHTRHFRRVADKWLNLAAHLCPVHELVLRDHVRREWVPPCCRVAGQHSHGRADRIAHFGRAHRLAGRVDGRYFVLTAPGVDVGRRRPQLAAVTIKRPLPCSFAACSALNVPM